jgi:very-short-patch-repair endonuclease
VAIGDDAAISHVSAAVLHGFWPYKIPVVVDVTVPRELRSRRGIRVHQAASFAVTTHLDIRVTTPVQTLFDLAATMRSDSAFRRVAHEAQVQEKVTVAQLRADLDGLRPRCPGAARLAAEIAHGPRPTRSSFEDRIVELLRRDDVPPFETNVHPPGTPDWVEVDILFRAQKLVIEVDGGRYHSTPYRRELDARKQAFVEAAGYRVLRVRDEDSDAEVVARVLLQLGR